MAFLISVISISKLTTTALLLSIISSLTGASIVPRSQAGISKSRDVCPDSYPGFLYHKESQTYYLESRLPIPGPCGKFMLLYKENDELVVCKCETLSYGPGRPLVYNDAEKRCYYAYEQGPCKTGQWFVYNKQNNPECQRNPCPVSPSTDDDWDSIPLNFYFTDQKGNCYRTNTSDYCPDKKLRVFFIGTENQPVCLEEQPPSVGGSPGISSPIICPEGTKLEDDGGCAKVVSFS